MLLTTLALLPRTRLAALTPEECSTAHRAHELLLAGSWEARRTFRLTVNGDIKNREVARLNFSAGRLETEVLEYEQFSKLWVHDSENKDFVLEMEFSCDRLVMAEDGRYVLMSEDGSEAAEFELELERGALRPIAWRADEAARLLFKKYAIAARTAYSDFEWTQPEPATDDE